MKSPYDVIEAVVKHLGYPRINPESLAAVQDALNVKGLPALAGCGYRILDIRASLVQILEDGLKLFAPAVRQPRPVATARPLCKIGDLEFHAPEVNAPPLGGIFYVAEAGGPSLVMADRWHGFAFQMNYLKAGLVHIPQDAAMAHSVALSSINLQALKGSND